MLLALDTSTRQMSIAVYDGTQVLNEATWKSNFHHTTELAPAALQAVERAGVNIDAIEVLGVALGPGSFTALRVGLAFAKGLALSRHIPIVGVPTLDFLAAAQPISDIQLLAILEAGRKRLAAGWYKAHEGKWKAKKKPQLFAPKELSKKITRPTIICGEMNAGVRKILQRKWKNARLVSPAQSQRRPAYLAELAWERWIAGDVDDPVSLAPIYISQGNSP